VLQRKAKGAFDGCRADQRNRGEEAFGAAVLALREFRARQWISLISG